LLKSLFDPSLPVLRPEHIVTTFTKRKPDELALPPRAVIVFNGADGKLLMKEGAGQPLMAWLPYRRIYRLGGGETIVTRSGFGGPNIVSLVEELFAYGVREFLLWGYCGGIAPDIRIGDLIVARAAVREEGASYHYVQSDDDRIECGWDEWRKISVEAGFREGIVWTTDALYRETSEKVRLYRERGIAGVEMEVASFYAACRFKDVHAIALLVVSDLIEGEVWRAGFSTREFKGGVKALARLIRDRFIR
jgi:uridine phosphorylase